MIIPWDFGVSGDMCELVKVIIMSVPLMRDYRKEEANRKGWLKNTRGGTGKRDSKHRETRVEGRKRRKTQT